MEAPHEDSPGVAWGFVGRITRILKTAPDERVVRQLVRYGIVAGSGYLLAIALYSGELAIGIPPYLGLGIAFVLNGLYNFALVRLWAFPPSGRGLRSDLTRFCLVAAVSFVVNYASFAVLYSAIGLHAATSQRLAILIAAPVTFFANRLWSFRARRPLQARQTDGEEPATSRRNESYSRM
jgi:putative flippase GtrA